MTSRLPSLFLRRAAWQVSGSKAHTCPALLPQRWAAVWLLLNSCLAVPRSRFGPCVDQLWNDLLRVTEVEVQQPRVVEQAAVRRRAVRDENPTFFV